MQTTFTTSSLCVPLPPTLDRQVSLLSFASDPCRLQVGGGTAGCVLASRLSLLVGSPKVLLLDRGEAHRGWTAGVPLLSTAWQMDEGATFFPLIRLAVHGHLTPLFQSTPKQTSRCRFQRFLSQVLTVGRARSSGVKSLAGQPPSTAQSIRAACPLNSTTGRRGSTCPHGRTTPFCRSSSARRRTRASRFCSSRRPAHHLLRASRA